MEKDGEDPEEAQYLETLKRQQEEQRERNRKEFGTEGEQVRI